MADGNTEKMARLADVAKAAGVSQGTVSNVFNKPGVVRDEVREHVRAVARQLGYRGPDPRGRVLRAGKVNAIGVTTTQPMAYFFTDPFARVMMTGITEASGAQGVGISLVSAATEEELSWNIGNALVDGLILFCLDDASQLIALARERQLPFVALALGQFDDTVSTIGIDNVGGARQAAEHLVGFGHRRFAVLTLKLSESGHGRRTMADVRRTVYATTRDRLTGYAEALAGVDIAIEDVPIFETQNDAESVGAALTELFAAPSPPTAILAQSDRVALFAMAWLAAHGHDVPGDVSVVGFDGVPEAAQSVPPLTTVAQPIAEIGRRAVKLILEHGSEVRQEILDVALVVRGSTAPPPS